MIDTILRVCFRPITFGLLIGALFTWSARAEAVSSETAPTTEPAAFEVKVHGAEGTPVILIPGLGSPGSVWDGLVQQLVDDGYQAHVLTLAGFAGRPAVAAPLLPKVHRQLISYAQGLARPPAIIGHSLGGTMALWLAASAADSVGPVVAVDGVAFLPALGNPAATEETSKPQADQLRAMISSMSAQAYHQQTQLTLANMITDPAQAKAVAEASKGSDPAAIGDAMAYLMSHDLRDDLIRRRIQSCYWPPSHLL